jgi:hypothetical protein
MLRLDAIVDAPAAYLPNINRWARTQERRRGAEGRPRPRRGGRRDRGRSRPCSVSAAGSLLTRKGG